jgi:hypothetical protein
MRLQHYITELFDTKVDIKIVKQNPSMCIYEFTIKELKYSFKADKYRGTWEILFVSDVGISITGTGNAIQVFAAIAKCLNIFLKKYKPMVFWFSAKEPSRKKLYLKMSKLITKKYSYKFKTESEDIEDDEIYVFKRN